MLINLEVVLTMGNAEPNKAAISSWKRSCWVWLNKEDKWAT